MVAAKNRCFEIFKIIGVCVIIVGALVLAIVAYSKYEVEPGKCIGSVGAVSIVILASLGFISNEKIIIPAFFFLYQSNFGHRKG